jgi:hypothetical protein
MRALRIVLGIAVCALFVVLFPARALDDAGRKRAGQRDFDAWTDGLKLTVTKHLSADDTNRALNYVY